MNIPLFFISIFLIFTVVLSPVGLILMYVSFKLNKKDRPEYEMNTYDEEMLEDMRCKGLCDRIPDDRPFGNAYKTHALCRRCDKWIRKTYLVDDNCPCCKRRPKLVSRKDKREDAVRYDMPISV